MFACLYLAIGQSTMEDGERTEAVLLCSMHKFTFCCARSPPSTLLNAAQLVKELPEAIKRHAVAMHAPSNLSAVRHKSFMNGMEGIQKS